MNTVYAPDTVTEGESFLWRMVDDRLQVGVALLWKQGAFRGLANYALIQETATTPSLRVGFGLQGIATGNPGYFAVSEKRFALLEGDVSTYAGIGFRANENHGHLLGGAKITPGNGLWTFGIQADGHHVHPFATVAVATGLSVGAYWIETRSLGIMVSYGWK